MVTWGPNTVSTFSSGNTGAAFCTPATPATPSTSLFGKPAAATPAASPATPAFSFSSQPNPINSPSTSLFSTPATPTLAAAPTSAFGFSSATPAAAPTPNANAYAQALGAPQQAALQAHMNAAMHQEQSRLSSQLMQLQQAYNPTPSTTLSQPQSQQSSQSQPPRFQYIFYDPITQAQRLEKLSLPSYPPKPPQISNDEWYTAITQNPDPDEYIPILITSAEGLHSRLVAQQSKTKLHEQYMNQLDQTLEQREQTHEAISMQLSNYERRNKIIQGKLHSILQKFEMCRGKNVPLQNSERVALRKLMDLAQAVENCGRMVEGVKRDAKDHERQWEVMKLQRGQGQYQYQGGVSGSVSASGKEGVLDPGFREEAMTLLNESKVGIDSLKKAVKRSERDMQIVKRSGGRNAAAVGTMG